MKITPYLAGFAAFAFAATSYADVTVNVTGATAFRGATLASIKAKYVASGAAFKFAHDQDATKLTGATRAIFIGTFPGVTGTTTIRCCFTGSVEGIRALIPTVTDPLPPTYYQPSLLSGTTAVVGGAELASQGTTGAAALGGISDIAFSDVSSSSSPYAASSLQPSDPAAGVIVFTMITNKNSTITNVTAQQFRALLTKGFQPLSLFSGDQTQDPDGSRSGVTPNPATAAYVFATGRNDGSGTRTTYLAETGFGVANTVNQYVTNVSTDTTLTTIQRVPAGGVNSPVLAGQSASNASTVWGQDIDGNGGYSSGATLRGDMAKSGESVTVLDETGADAFGSLQRAYLVTWLSLSDAATARSNGAIFCGYNGVKLNDIAAAGTAMSDADKAKVVGGVYSAWGYERMYLRNDVTSGDKLTVYTGVKGAIPSNLGTAGLALTDMKVSRSTDGGTVAP